MVLSEHARPRHHKQALLVQDLVAEALLKVSALQSQRPCLRVCAARLQSTVAPALLHVHKVVAGLHLRAPGPLADHLAHHPGRGGVLLGAGPHAVQLLRRGSTFQGLSHSRGHLAQLLVGIHEGFVGLLVDDEGVYLVEDEHAVLIGAEVPPAARDARVERLDVLCLAVADVRVGVHARRERGVLP